MRALDAALGTPWAIQQYALDQLLTIASREHEVTPEALEKYRAESVDRSETLEKRGSVAVLNVTGPLFRRANLFTAFSGATSYEILRRDLQVALDNRDISAILLNVDSPGGAANGCGELAKAIFDANKPVVAYVGGTAASAAYWLASAASQIVVDDSAAVGSIGVIVGLTDDSERTRAAGIRRFEFVSSQTPLKNGDPATLSGAAEYQRVADETAQVFIQAVAKHRGVDEETVAADFGRGGVLVGANAVEVGMADRIGTFEETLAELAKGGKFRRAPAAQERRQAASATPAADAAEPAAIPAAPTSQTEDPMADENKAGDKTADIEAARKDAASAAVKADRERRASIMALPEAKGREGLADHLYASTEMSVDQIQAALAAAPEAKAEASDSETDAKAYEASRVAGAGLGGQQPKPTAGDRLATKMKAKFAKEAN